VDGDAVGRNGSGDGIEEAVVSLTGVWLQLSDGDLVRADQAGEISVHPTPQLAGKPARWLVTVVVPAVTGAGDAAGWRCGPLHRTLAQCDDEPGEARLALARLLARLDGLEVSPRADLPAGQRVRFVFTPFEEAERSAAPETRPASASRSRAAGSDPLADALDSAFAFLAGGDEHSDPAGPSGSGRGRTPTPQPTG
jgi:hypothetical protein